MFFRIVLSWCVLGILMVGPVAISAPDRVEVEPIVPVLGLQNPFSIEQLPPSRARARLESLNQAAQSRALNWLHRFDFPSSDLEHIDFDDQGGVLYVDPVPEIPFAEKAAPEGSLSSSNIQFVSVAGDRAFSLHSRPGSPNVVYLDFTGHTFSNLAWGPETTQANPFDLDGNPAVFGDSERQAIAEIWHRVAEDFAPFDVDVTTEEPNVFTTQTGHVLITSKNQVDGQPMPYANSGGVAYVGVFGHWAYVSHYSPALVYFDNLQRSAPLIAEAASHEFGHNLGLSHDGTSASGYYSGHGSGNTSWAPIMGVGYWRNVTQWSRGEYLGANNPQDDLFIIADKLARVPDDHGDDLSSATPLVVEPDGAILASDPEIDPDDDSPGNKGIINSSSDLDVFSFMSSGGAVEIQVRPAWQAFYRDTKRGANLDVRATVVNSAGQVVTESDPGNETHALISSVLPAGVYYLTIEGAGSSNYSDYASQGRYYVTGLVSTTSAPNADPSAQFGVSCSELDCHFVSTATDTDGHIAAWSWDFGDRSTANVENPNHRFAMVGSYTVTLTVTDDDGATDQASRTIDVWQSNVPLNIGSMDTGAYGNGYGSDAHYAELFASFQNTGTDLILSVVGYDIDFSDEVVVYLNNTRLGYLSRGPNNGLNVGDHFQVPADAQIQGSNLLRFQQNTPGWIWGVTNLLLRQNVANPDSDIELTVGTLDTGAYGNGFGSDENFLVLEAVFEGSETNLQLSVTGYDVDFGDEIAVYLNDGFLGYLSAGANNALNGGNTFMISADDQRAGDNVIRFEQRNAGWIWGVTNLLLENWVMPPDFEVRLEIGETDASEYGHRFGSNAHQTALRIAFDSTGSDLAFSVTGYDIDFSDEVAVFANEKFVAHLRTGPNNGFNAGETILIPATLQHSGENNLRIEQRTAGWIWGVTDLLLLEHSGADANGS